ncbi:MAG: HlyD family efflux transporter periplasmic adaptor subunit [Elusimicrobia bacterium]|nr:HlyD family efflux transporter periplasmic adaptor subunit [Elusimicrobiota bacterium]
MKKVKHVLLKILIYGAVAAVLGGGGWWGYRAYKKTSLVEGEIEKVNVAKGDIDVKFQDIGEVRPKDVMEVYSRVGGRITEVLTREGAYVKKGAKLAVVQPGQTDSDKFVPVDVNAPISGTVMTCPGGDNSLASIAKIDQRIGGLADGNPSCLMQVGDFTSLVVGLNVSEMEVMKLRTGLPVKVTIDALAALPLTGRITLISPKSDSGRGAKSFKVEIGIDQKNLDKVKSGMTSRIEAVMESKRNTLTMPISGLFEERGRRFAYIVVPGGKARKADLKIGLRNETDVEILSGLKEGDTVYADKPLNIEADAPAAAAAPPPAVE